MRLPWRWRLLAAVWTVMLIVIAVQTVSYAGTPLHVARLTGGGLRDGEVLVCIGADRLRAMPPLNQTLPPPMR